MAKSPTHKFGQIIGFVLEQAVEPHLRAFADRHGLYLDTKGPRKARGKRKKISWVDQYENAHDLDYVLERGGTDERSGEPIAFIETAWRRYTKHSRNKAQEIQGAILPLRETHSRSAPFIGAILAGVFTSGALNQLRRHRFTTLFFSAEEIAKAFRRVGIDAQVMEDTPDEEVALRVAAWEKLSVARRAIVPRALVEIDSSEFRSFMSALERTVTRRVVLVRILPLHGEAADWTDVAGAIRFIESYNESAEAKPVIRYEIEIRYNNEDKITGNFRDKASAVDFLRSY